MSSAEGRIEELMATGLARDEAESEARRRFGDFESYRDAATAIDEQIVHERRRRGAPVVSIIMSR